MHCTTPDVPKENLWKDLERETCKLVRSLGESVNACFGLDPVPISCESV